LKYENFRSALRVLIRHSIHDLIDLIIKIENVDAINIILYLFLSGSELVPMEIEVI
jgi:hypothetical protein